jgi:hypothetical protein
MSPEEPVASSQQPHLDISIQHQKATTPPPFLLLLNGFPGVGKLTLARSLSSIFAQEVESTVPEMKIRLIDNHLLIDPVSAIEPERTESHYALRKSLRDVAFSALQSLPGDFIILMTSCLSETEEGVAQFEEHVKIAEGRGCAMVALNVVCGEQENVRRLESDERMLQTEGGKGKLVDGKVLERLRGMYTLLNLERMERSGAGGARVVCRELETTNLSVEEATDRVLRFLRESLGF